MKAKGLYRIISFSIAAIGLLFANGKEVYAQETFIQDNICYEVTGNGTVEVDDLTEGFNEKILTIPSTVTYNNQAYTVNSVNMDHLSRYYRMVEEMVVPATVTEQVVVVRTGYAKYIRMEATLETLPEDKRDGNYDDFIESILLREENEAGGKGYENHWECMHLDYQAFPTLKKVRFLGEAAPKLIQIEKYLYGEDLYYEVPIGAVDAYRANSKNINVLFYECFNDLSIYQTREIAPIVMSQGESTPETNLFSTSKGDYLVKEKAGSGVGKVILLHAIPKEQKDVNYDYVVESKVTNGMYSYEVDEIASGALTAIYTNVLTIPDTVTTLNPQSLTYHVSCVFLSKKCKKVPEEVLFEIYDADEGVPFVYATGLEKIGKKDPFFIVGGTLIVSKNAKIQNAKKNYKNLVRVTPVKKGATIQAPKEISVKINESKSIKASFKSKTKEHLRYVLLGGESSVQTGENSYVKLSPDGKITAKEAGTAYVLVYSLESGKHKVVKINVKKETFKKGIYTYAINGSEYGKHTVTIRKCNPSKNKKTLVLPSKVTYKGITYTVTGAYAEEFIDWSLVEYSEEHFGDGYKYVSYYPNPKPIISDKVAKKSKITKIVVPATMTDAVFLTGKLPKLTKIECKGNKPPKKISYWATTENQVTVYVPKKKLSKYRDRIYGYGKDWSRSGVEGYAKKYVKGY